MCAAPLCAVLGVGDLVKEKKKKRKKRKAEIKVEVGGKNGKRKSECTCVLSVRGVQVVGMCVRGGDSSGRGIGQRGQFNK